MASEALESRRSNSQPRAAWTRYVATACLLLAGCGSQDNGPSRRPAASDQEQQKKGAETMSINVTSSAFENNQPIPHKYAKKGENISPPIAWDGLPEKTRELALIVDDPDAPTEQPFVHWVIYKIPADVQGLAEDVPKQPRLETPAGALQGPNDYGEIGYGGPQPPSGTHRYQFHLYALDQPLDIQPGLTKSGLLEAMAGHILAEGELVGTYAAQ